MESYEYDAEHYDDSSMSSEHTGTELMAVEVLKEFSNATSKIHSRVKECVDKYAGTVLKMIWPAGSTIVIDPNIDEWEKTSDGRSRILQYCCCDIFAHPIGRAHGVYPNVELIVLIDIFGSFYVYSPPPDDAVYMLNVTPEGFAAMGFKYYYPIHSLATPVETGMVLTRLWGLIKRNVDVNTIHQFIIRGHGEKTAVARAIIGTKETLRICSLGCMQWAKNASGSRHPNTAQRPHSEVAIVPLGKVKQKYGSDFGIPVYMGLTTGKVYGLNIDRTCYLLVAHSLPAFARLGLAQYLENRRYGRRDVPDAMGIFERPPACPSEF